MKPRISIRLAIAASVALAALAGCRAKPPGKTETATMYWIKRHVTIGGKKDKNPLPATAANIDAGKHVFGDYCVECHGRIDQMDEVYHAKPLSMAFCLDCHRDPARRVRPLEKITDLSWAASSPDAQREMGGDMVQKWHVQSLENCSTCHR